ncbi:hypothetical protein GH5_04380 [Leishmania sp. Ghana 2012 LV757]|uniref:hypothetical protein n=1 Tax=Leishmania sp. Ghana 2012 LV757 TaxID=2803181 RepID=UPI001B65F294|nr:hypothetical protein GH5_04380 [Leishmania sp. Ghana 2012 LV757]
MSSAAAACTSRPLSGVRVFLHIRLGPSDEDGRQRISRGGSINYVKKRKGDGSRASARDVLRTARAHVQQLGATLALSEAAADLVVFHGGRKSFLEAAHMKLKAVVRPDYLAACVAADQRVDIAPYIVTPAVIAAAAKSTAPDLKSAGTISSAAPSSHTFAAPSRGALSTAVTHANNPGGTRSGAANNRPAGGSAAAAPSSASSGSPSCAPRSQLRFGAEASTPAQEPTSLSQPHRLPFLDEDEDGGKLDSQQRQQPILAALKRAATAREEGAVAASVAPASASSSLHAEPIATTNREATRLYHLLDDMPNGKTYASHRAAGPPHSDGAVSQKRAECFLACSSSSVISQQRRSATCAKCRAHPASTGAVELNEVITQQPITGTASTPRLTPSPRHEFSSDGSQGALTVALPDRSSRNGSQSVVATSRRGEADTEEEEAIRHAVLRSTATVAVTRRRGRPSKQADSTPTLGDAASLLVDRMTGGRNTMSKRDQDPFLTSGGHTQRQPLPQLTSALLSSEVSDVEVAFTQPLAASSLESSTAAALQQTPSTVSLVPTQRIAKRPRRSSAADDCTEGPTHRAHTAPADKAQRSRQRRRAQSAEDGAVGEEIRKPSNRQRQCRPGAQRRRRVASRGRTEVLRDFKCTPAAEPPFSIAFTDLALLRPLTPDDEEMSATVARLRVHVFLDGDAAAASLSFFLRDVVEQLGAACVVLDGDDSGEYLCWFGRHKRVREGWRSRTTQKPTHLVVSPCAALTPDILFCKALGVPIVTPQWVYDAIALGTFPTILPHIHAHPVYGDRHVAGAAVAAAAGAPRRDELLGGEEEDGDVVGGTVVWANANPTLSLNSSSAGATAAVPRAGMCAAAAGPRCPRRCGGSSTLRQLHKEVAEEYVPAGEQAMRPFYARIFHDRMFYLYVPPTDLLYANATGGGARPPRSSRASRHNHSGSYLGDAVAALAQVTELLRVLGGTVTRNVESTHLDLVIDLKGFYHDMAKVGLTAREQDWQQDRARTLRESLSGAFHDALRRMSQQPASMGVNATAATTDAASTAPPVVGIAWLIYSILTRQWTAVDSFVLAGHPLTAQITAGRPCAPLSGPADADMAKSREDATASGAVAEPAGEDALVPAGSPVVTVTPHAHAPLMRSSHEAAAESSSRSLWSAVVAAAVEPHLKCAQGQQAALKQASHQLDTQEIAAVLGDAQPLPLGVSGKAAPVRITVYAFTTPVRFDAVLGSGGRQLYL